VNKIIKSEPIMKSVIDGYKNRDVYVACDGKEFYSESACVEHEAKILSKAKFKEKYQLKMHYMSDWFFETIFVKEIDKQTLLEIEKYWPQILRSDIRPGINIVTDSSGDDDFVTVTHPDTEIDRHKSIIEKMEEVKKSY